MRFSFANPNFLLLLGLVFILLSGITQFLNPLQGYSYLTPENATIAYGQTQTFYLEEIPNYPEISWYLDEVFVSSSSSSYTTSPLLAVGDHTIRVRAENYETGDYFDMYAYLTVTSPVPTPAPSSSPPPPSPTPSPTPTPTPTPPPSPSPPPQPDKINVVVQSTTGGSTSPSVGTHQYTVGDQLTFVATPDNNYDFDYWLLSDGSKPLSQSYQTIASESFTIKAYFKAVPPPEPTPPPDPDKQTLIVETTPGGSTTPTPGTYVYDDGSVQSLMAKANTGFKFDHWLFSDGNKDYSASLSLTMDKSYSVKAVFEKVETSTPTLPLPSGGGNLPELPELPSTSGGGVSPLSAGLGLAGIALVAVGAIKKWRRRK